jgi:hypothetical protein
MCDSDVFALIQDLKNVETGTSTPRIVDRDWMTRAGHIWRVMEEQHNEIKKLQRILSFVPGRVAIDAKEAAGYGDRMRTMN